MSKKVVVATIEWDPEAEEGHEWCVQVSEMGRGMLATLSDFELRVCAAEVSLVVGHALEMPPSPETLR